MPGRGTKRKGAVVKDTTTESAAPKDTPKDTPTTKARKSTPTVEDPSLLLQAAGKTGKPDDHVGKSSGKDPALELWKKGTSQAEWDCDLPTSLETPDHLAITCPLITQQLIWAGGYVNIACFIPKEDGEELTTRLEWSEGTLKQQTTPRQIRNIFDWTSAFIRFMGIYLQHHPGKSLEMLRYMDIIRLAYTKWGGFGWRAYDEQFMALVAQYPK